MVEVSDSENPNSVEFVLMPKEYHTFMIRTTLLSINFPNVTKLMHKRINFS